MNSCWHRTNVMQKKKLLSRTHSQLQQFIIIFYYVHHCIITHKSLHLFLQVNSRNNHQVYNIYTCISSYVYIYVYTTREYGLQEQKRARKRDIGTREIINATINDIYVHLLRFYIMIQYTLSCIYVKKKKKKKKKKIK